MTFYYIHFGIVIVGFMLVLLVGVKTQMSNFETLLGIGIASIPGLNIVALVISLIFLVDSCISKMEK